MKMVVPLYAARVKYALVQSVGVNQVKLQTLTQRARTYGESLSLLVMFKPITIDSDTKDKMHKHSSDYTFLFFYLRH